MIEIVPTDNDVLCGRGGATNNHPGNRKFRRLVSERQAVYLESRKRDKADIARSIVQTIRESGGRFLKKVDEKGDQWVDVGDKKATEKTSQALREGLDVRAGVVPMPGPLAAAAKRKNEEAVTAAINPEATEAGSPKRMKTVLDRPTATPAEPVLSSVATATMAPLPHPGNPSHAQTLPHPGNPASSGVQPASQTTSSTAFQAPPVNASDCSNVAEV